MLEAFGDSTRDGDWAAVRLLVDGDRIVEADAPGLDHDLRGLTLLEAAAVGGETLAVDALANALGPVFCAEPRPGRTAVAMSGGVDSAVALLRAGEQAGRDEVRDEERSFLLMYLRDFAGPDGMLPIDFDGLVRDSFGDLVGAR